MSFKVDAEIADMITPDDHNALHAIYQHRCLNEQQLTGTSTIPGTTAITAIPCAVSGP